MQAIGIHVFAGGFTMGVRQVANVQAQLETHGLGRETVIAMGIPFIQTERWEDWPPIQADMIYGNPRCSGFSTLTAGYASTSHGPWSKQTADIHDLCQYGVKNKIPIISFESVQQCYSTGRPLLDKLRDELFVPAGYRIAHLFINAASFGNAQTRRRYFFVAYPENCHFNIQPPQVSAYHATTRDVIEQFVRRKTRVVPLYRKDAEYDGDCWCQMTPDELAVMPYFQPGEDLHKFAQRDPMQLRMVSPKFYEKWDNRISDIPFSAYCPYRLRWDYGAPTIHGASSRLIHPSLNRGLTVRELAAIMGWPVLPQGSDPIGQIGKGVVPAIGIWLAQQAEFCLLDAWHGADWESSYNSKNNTWEGRDTLYQVEKVFNLTRYHNSYRRNNDA